MQNKIDFKTENVNRDEKGHLMWKCTHLRK